MAEPASASDPKSDRFHWICGCNSHASHLPVASSAGTLLVPRSCFAILEAVTHLSIVTMESYALKELSEADVRRVEEHVARCAKCRYILEEQLGWAAAMRSPFRRAMEKMIDAERKKRRSAGTGTGTGKPHRDEHHLAGREARVTLRRRPCCARCRGRSSWRLRGRSSSDRAS